MPLSGEEVIQRYFKCIDAKDLGSILYLFDYDAVVFEPFSNIEGGLRGRSSIEPFLKIAMMANAAFGAQSRSKNQARQVLKRSWH